MELDHREIRVKFSATCHNRSSRTNRRRLFACAAAVAPLFAAAPALADYVFVGPDGGNWNLAANWIKSVPPAHDPITYYPGETGSATDLTQTTNINNYIAGAQAGDTADTIFDPGAGVTATIGRL